MIAAMITGRRHILPLLAGLSLPLLLAGGAAAQSLTLDFGEPTGSTTARIVQLIMLTTVLTLAPSILLMVTCFTRLIIVFSLLRNALGTGTSPPNQVLVSLALFMTFFIMQPTFQQAWDDGVRPMINEQIDEEEAFTRAVQPFKVFMAQHTRDKDLRLFLDMAKLEPAARAEDNELRALVPAFMISELLRAFEIGFLVFVPFIVIDMVVASVLMSMGMMMLPPMMLAMPFKLIFFVLVDGWHLLVGSLVQGYGIIQ